MRLFIAMNFPEELRTRWVEGAAALRAVAPGARWAPPAQMHLTLAFLGERPESIISPLTSGLDGIAATSPRLSVAVQGIGAFPTWRHARIVWLGVEQSPPLMRLAEAIAHTCRELGMPGESRPFHPHITLARLDDRISTHQIRELERVAREATDRIITTIDSVDLMASTLGPGTARHEVVHRAKLGSG